MEFSLNSFEPRRILVIQLRQIGDVLLATPAVRALRRRYPKAYLAFLADETPALVLKDNPHLDETITRPANGGWRESLATIRRVRQGRFDLVVDFLANPRTALITWLSGARITISWSHRRRHFIYTHPVAPEGSYPAAQKLSLLRVLGIAGESVELEMPVPAFADGTLKNFFSSQGLLNGRPVICFEPCHKRPVRQWPGRHYARLADLVAQKWKAHVVFRWAPGKAAEVKEILKQAEGKHVLAPATDLHELAALYRRSDLYVGNDCGPRHIAVSQGIPTFSIHGPSDETWTAPGPRHRTVAKKIDCRPCGLISCPDPHHACLEELSPEEVFAELDRFWNFLQSRQK